MNKKEKYLRTKLKDFEIYTWIIIILSSYFYIGILLKLFSDQFHDAKIIIYLTVGLLGISSYLIYQIRQIHHKLEQHEQD